MDQEYSDRELKRGGQRIAALFPDDRDAKNKMLEYANEIWEWEQSQDKSPKKPISIVPR